MSASTCNITEERAPRFFLMFYYSKFSLDKYNCARLFNYVVKQVSLFIYYLRAYLFRDTVCVADIYIEW